MKKIKSFFLLLFCLILLVIFLSGQKINISNIRNIIIPQVMAQCGSGDCSGAGCCDGKVCTANPPNCGTCTSDGGCHWDGNECRPWCTPNCTNANCESVSCNECTNEDDTCPEPSPTPCQGNRCCNEGDFSCDNGCGHTIGCFWDPTDGDCDDQCGTGWYVERTWYCGAEWCGQDCNLCDTPTPPISRTPTPTRPPSLTPTITLTPPPTSTPTITPTTPPTSTPTPLPTSTPVPTSTPLPTSTPTPTFTPTPTITPTPACTCESMDITSGTIAPGEILTFTTIARAVSANTKVDHMIYRVEKYHEGETPILINGPDTVTAADIGSGRYSTAYPWQIPANESGLVTYHAWAEIWCAYKESGDAALPQNYASTAVLGESTNVGFLERIWQFILSLVGAKRLTPEIYQQVYPTLTYKYKSIVPTDANSLQYGTFNPLTPTPAIAKDCTNVWITFQYPGE